MIYTINIYIDDNSSLKKCPVCMDYKIMVQKYINLFHVINYLIVFYFYK